MNICYSHFLQCMWVRSPMCYIDCRRTRVVNHIPTVGKDCVLWNSLGSWQKSNMCQSGDISSPSTLSNHLVRCLQHMQHLLYPELLSKALSINWVSINTVHLKMGYKVSHPRDVWHHHRFLIFGFTFQNDCQDRGPQSLSHPETGSCGHGLLWSISQSLRQQL